MVHRIFDPGVHPIWKRSVFDFFISYMRIWGHPDFKFRDDDLRINFFSKNENLSATF